MKKVGIADKSLSNFWSYDNNNAENVINSKYYPSNKLLTLKEIADKSSLSLFHLNNCSLSESIDDLEYINQTTTDLISLLFQSQGKSNIDFHQLL